MKRIVATLFLITYLLTASGLVFNLHYCGGVVSSVRLELTKDETKRCPCGSKKMSKDCCKDTKFLVKVKDAHKLASNLLELKAPIAKWVPFVPPFIHLDISLPLYTERNQLYAHAPPGQANNSLFLLNNTFRI